VIDAGFATTGLYANTYLAEKLGFDRGFDSWVRVPDGAIGKRVKQDVATWNDGRRHFLYVHLLGSHSTLKPSQTAAAKWKIDPSFLAEPHGLDVGAAKRNQVPGIREAYVAAYHAVLEDTDARIAEILTELAPYRDDTVLVFTSDHGEMLGEHELFGHGYQVFEPLTHVPMIAVHAGELPDAIGGAAVPDIVTTSLGVPHTWPTSRYDSFPLVSQREGKVALALDAQVKGIWDGPLRVFDLLADPGELAPLTGRDADLVAARAAWEARTPPGALQEGRVVLDPETVSALRALGYVTAEEQASADTPEGPP
jgi:hypothetical protein